MDHGGLNSEVLQKSEAPQEVAATGATSGSEGPSSAAAATSWHDTWPVHPACELVPATPADELLVLGKDIVETGCLTAEIVLWRADPKSPLQLLDGRSRLDALELVIGKPVEIGPPSLACGDFVALNRVAVLDGGSVDPYAYVISTNLRRRNLTDEQRQSALIKLIARTPSKSDREIGKEVGVDHKVIGRARAKGEATGAVAPVEKRVGGDGKARKQPSKKAAKGSRNRTRAGAPETADRDGGDGADHGDVQGCDRGDVQGGDRGDVQGGDTGQPAASAPAGSQAWLDELAHKVRVRDIRIHALEGEIADLKRAAAEQSGDLVSVWNNGTDAELAAGLRAIGRDDIFRDIFRIMPDWKSSPSAFANDPSVARQLESEIEELKAENAELRAKLEVVQGAAAASPKIAATDTVTIGDPGPIPEFLQRKPAATETSESSGGVTLQDAVAKVFSDLSELDCECRGQVDNAPPGLDQSERIQILDETADVLESLRMPVVPAELAGIKVKLPKHRRPRSRGERRDAALGIIAACAEALNAIDKNDARYDKARALCDALEDASSEAEGCEFS